MTAVENLFKILLVELSPNPNTGDLNEQLNRWQRAFLIDQPSLTKVEQQLVGKIMHQVKLKKISPKKAYFMLTQYLVCSGLENSRSVFAMTYVCGLLAKQPVNHAQPVIEEFVSAKAKIDSHSISGYDCVQFMRQEKYLQPSSSLRRVS